MICIQVKSNSVYINPDAVAGIAGKGLKGSKGSVIHLVGGQDIETGYPVTQLHSILFGGN